jgi:glycosyltransferase involved in cell wall biosynthesis
MRAQEQAMPAGETVVSCPAPYGVGGLGRHLEEIVEALERRGRRPVYLSEDDDTRRASRRGRPRMAELIGAFKPLGRLSPAWRMWAVSVEFDASRARALPPAEHLIAFNGTALAQFRAARRAGAGSVSLMAANSHMRHVVRQHELAHRRHPIERPWPTHLVRRNMAEYALADRIHVSSAYVRDSFLAEGHREESLDCFPLTPHPRFEPTGEREAASTFDIVYSGSLVIHKGVPLLVDAFRALPYADARLILVGGWKSPGMRRFIESARAEDPRIVLSPGDPARYLRSARLCVHPSYEDGFAYAPAEAMACGVPVIVSEDTGMKELIDPGRDGLILPTGDSEQLTAAIEAVYRGEILGA